MKKLLTILMCLAVVVFVGKVSFAEDENDIVKRHQERIKKIQAANPDKSLKVQSVRTDASLLPIVRTDFPHPIDGGPIVVIPALPPPVYDPGPIDGPDRPVYDPGPIDGPDRPVYDPGPIDGPDRPVYDPGPITPEPELIPIDNGGIVVELDQRKTIEAQIELKGNGKNYTVSPQMADAPKEVGQLQKKQ